MICFQLISRMYPNSRVIDVLSKQTPRRRLIQHVDQLRAPREPLPAAGLARAQLQAGQHGARHQGAVAQPPQGGPAPKGKVQQEIDYTPLSPSVAQVQAYL